MDLYQAAYFPTSPSHIALIHKLITLNTTPPLLPLQSMIYSDNEFHTKNPPHYVYECIRSMCEGINWKCHLKLFFVLNGILSCWYYNVLHTSDEFTVIVCVRTSCRTDGQRGSHAVSPSLRAVIDTSKNNNDSSR